MECVLLCSSGRDVWERSPIGEAVSGSKIYILDSRQHPAPVGVVGELVAVEECGSFHHSNTTIKVSKQQPVTKTEQKMQEIWCRVWNMDSTSIGLDDNFSELGDNPTLAMGVVGMARSMAMKLTVADMCRHSSLKRLSHHISFGDFETA
ncbi:hypothetical protein V8C34DRAFT_268671 [Trichoderma compactum]